MSCPVGTRTGDAERSGDADETAGGQAPSHLIIDSQGPWAGPGSARLIRDAIRLAGVDVAVWLWLVGDGVTAALAPAVAVRELLAMNAARPGGVWVDRFSLARRGLDPADLADGVTVVDIDAVAALLLRPGVKAVWR